MKFSKCRPTLIGYCVCVCVHVLQNRGGGEGLRGCQGHLRSHTHHRFPQKTMKLQSVFSQERCSQFGANLPLFSSSFLSKLPLFTPTFLAPSFHSMFSSLLLGSFLSSSASSSPPSSYSTSAASSSTSTDASVVKEEKFSVTLRQTHPIKRGSLFLVTWLIHTANDLVDDGIISLIKEIHNETCPSLTNKISGTNRTLSKKRKE